MSTAHTAAVDRPPFISSSRMSEDGTQCQTPADGQQLSLQVLHQDAATITFVVDAEFFEANPNIGTNPNDWDDSANLKSVVPDSFPSARLFIARPHAGRSYRGQIVAAQLELRDYDAVTGTRLLQSRLSQWSEELSTSTDKRTPAGAVTYDRRTGRVILRAAPPSDPLAKAQYVPSPAVQSSSPTSANPHRPTLFSLLARLSDSSVTTLEQRFAIRHIVTDYLNNEISHAKVFSYLGQVVGYQALDDIIKSLPVGPPPPGQQTLAVGRIQQNFQMGHPQKSSPGVVVGTAPELTVQRQEGPCFTPSVATETIEGEDLNNEMVRRNKALLFRAFVKPLRWLYPEPSQHDLSLMTWGQQSVLLDRRAFFIGGAPRRFQNKMDGEMSGEINGMGEQTSEVNGMIGIKGTSVTNNTPLHAPTFQTIRVLDLVSLETRSIQSGLDNCPPSMTGHVTHLGAFISGPVSIVHGGILSSPSPIEGSRVLSPKPSQSLSSDSSVRLNTAVYGLDMISKRWMILDQLSKLHPPPRHSHCSAIFPISSEVVSGSSASYAKYLIIFGGIGSAKWKDQKGTDDVGTDDKNRSKLHSCDVKDLILLNDLWIYNFDSGNWSEIVLPTLPSPRFGSSLTWISWSSMILFGGEGMSYGTSGTPELGDAGLGLPGGGEREILSDTWILHFTEPNGTDNPEVQLAWVKAPAVGPPRAHYASIGLTACLPPASRGSSDERTVPGRAVWSSSVESAMKDLKSLGWVTQRVIFLISGTTKNADQIIYGTPSVLLGLVFPKSGTPNSFMIVWKSLEDIPLGAGHLGPPFQGRRNHTAIYFDALAELPAEQMMAQELKSYSIRFKSKEHPTQNDDVEMVEEMNNPQPPSYKPFARTPTCVPCILIVGGYTEQNRQLKEDLWVLKLSHLLPKFLKSESRSRVIEKRLLMGLLLSGMKCSPSIKQLLKLDDDDDTVDPSTSPVQFDIESLKIMKSVWSDPARNYQPALYQVGVAISTGLLWSLASLVRHPLSPFSHLLDNAVQRHVRANNVSICFERWHGHDAISITDDGSGLTHRGLHSLMKRFGHSSDDLSKRHHDQFGLGFKLAVGRLAHNAFVITKTARTYGVGLFSVPLNALMGSANLTCPIAFWSATDGFPVALPIEGAEFGQSVGMILHNTPLGTAGNLESEFQKFGKSTGTRIVMFGLRKDLPYPTIEKDGQITFTSLRYPDLFCVPTPDSTRARPFKPDLPTESISSSVDDVLMREVNAEEIRERDSNGEIKKSKDEVISNGGVQLVAPIRLHPLFPLWSRPKHSLDYNLASYLFWSQLHSEAKIHINGVQLKPNDMKISKTPSSSSSHQQPNPESESVLKSLKEISGIELPFNDRYGNSLYRFLQQRLYYKPKFGEEHFYGIVGFLNDHLQSPGKENETVCETGVLLYHKGRLINRAMLKMPVVPEFLEATPNSTAFVGCRFSMYFSSTEGRVPETANLLSGMVLTAAINVPDFLTPRATKEDFMSDSDLAFHDFYDRLESTLKEYVSVYWNSDGLKQLQSRYVRDFDAYREQRWMDRRRVRLDDIVNEQHRNKRLAVSEKIQQTNERTIVEKLGDNTISDDIMISSNEKSDHRVSSNSLEVRVSDEHRSSGEERRSPSPAGSSPKRRVSPSDSKEAGKRGRHTRC